MTDDYDDLEEAAEKMREQNEELLIKFQDWLAKSNLKDRTIQRHLDNVDFYINEFLLYDDIRSPAEGIFDINMYLGYWFIKKAMWSSIPAIKQNAASLKKFYKFMMEEGEVVQQDYQELLEIIKTHMPEWNEAMARYENLEIENPFDF